MSARFTGFAIALVNFGLDQAIKLWMLYGFDIAARQPVSVTSFFDLVLVWNRGISYGLLQQDSDLGRYFLAAFAFIVSLVIAVWIWRNTSQLVATGLGLVLGGALANGLDRLMHGAVVDLFHFYWGTFSWYVFNWADVAIVVGAALLIYESFIGKNHTSGPKDAAME